MKIRLWIGGAMALLNLAACTHHATTVQPAIASANLAARWQVVGASRLAYDWTKFTAILDWRKHSRGSADVGCNHLSYALQLAADGARVQIGEIMATRMACADDVMSLENALAARLNQHQFTVQAHGNGWILRDESGNTLTLQPAPEPAP